jgi:hypothetical protein
MLHLFKIENFKKFLARLKENSYIPTVLTLEFLKKIIRDQTDVSRYFFDKNPFAICAKSDSARWLANGCGAGAKKIVPVQRQSVAQGQ